MEDQIVIGRGSGSFVDLDDEKVSPIHAVIERRDAGYYLSDLGSRLGTKKNGQVILDVHLDNGDIIEIAGFTIEFYTGIPKPKAPPRAAQVTEPGSVVVPAKKESVPAVGGAASQLQTFSSPEKGTQTESTQERLGAENLIVLNPTPSGGGDENTFESTEVTDAIGRAVEAEREDTVTSPIGSTQKMDGSSVDISQTDFGPNSPQRPEARTATSDSPRLHHVATTPSAAGRASDAGAVPLAVRRKNELNQVERAASGHKKRWGRTFAPGNLIGDMRTHVKPSKGTVVEVLVVWNHRVLSTHHFTERGTIYAGLDDKAQILLPVVPGGARRIPLIVIDTQIVLLVPNQTSVTLINKQETLPLDTLVSKGRLLNQAALRHVRLEQGEMGVLEIGYGLEVYVRYVPEAPKPVLGPLLDMTASELMGLILAGVVAGVLSLFILLHVPPEAEKVSDNLEEQRRATFVFNRVETPPAPPMPTPEPTPVATPVPTPFPTPEPTPVKVVKVEVTDKKTTQRANQATPQVVKKDGDKEGRMGAVRANPNAKARSGVGAAKSGGSVKIGNTAGANAQSAEPNVGAMGLLSAFGNKGIRDRLDQTYSGVGTTMGLADQATGAAGQTSDRPGTDIGSALKETSTGKGKATIGVGGVKTSGRGGGVTGYGTGGLGNREKVSVLPGGEEEDFVGTIDREAVRRVVRKHLRELQSCYERGLNLDESLSGKVILEWEFGQRGRVLQVKTVSSTLNNQTVESCLMKRLQSWTFPEPPANQIAVVKYPFVFNAK